jgi:uracil-DNA glycosylase
MTHDPGIAAFVELLATLPSTDTAFNPWYAETDPGAIRRTNLSLYLHELKHRGSRLLLLGEAPGYQGCRLTGIPFMSEHLLLQGVPSMGLFGEARGYRRSTTGDRLRKEPSATIVWQTLAHYDLLPVLWPAFPFHPHKPGNSQSNRPPAAVEVAFGRTIWQRIVEVMDIEEIVAVGNVGHRSLAAAGIEAIKIRHPSQGGKPEFVAGIAALAASLRTRDAGSLGAE